MSADHLPPRPDRCPSELADMRARTSPRPPVLARLVGDRSGVAAVEFAMILPVMVFMYFGLIAVTVGINTDRKVTLVSRTVADLVGRTASMNETELDGIVSASAAVMAPYDAAGLEIHIASVVVEEKNSKLQGRICWSKGRKVKTGGTSEEINPPPTMAPGRILPETEIPEGFRTANTSYIATLTNQLYKPVVGENITGDINLSESTPWPVRNVKEIPYAGTASCLS